MSGRGDGRGDGSRIRVFRVREEEVGAECGQGWVFMSRVQSVG